MKQKLLRLILRALPVRVGNALLALRAPRTGKGKKQVELPSPQYKQNLVSAYAEQYKLPGLIETGTFEGAMVEACLSTFSRIISIELDKRLFQRAARKFAKVRHIEILHGDSAQVLPAVLSTVSGDWLFWLDAHNCGGMTAGEDRPNPVLGELRSVMSHPSPGHVVLIDDARYFTGKNGWPTIKDIRDLVGATRQDATISVENDIIRIVFPRSDTKQAAERVTDSVQV